MEAELQDLSPPFLRGHGSRQVRFPALAQGKGQ